MRKRCSVCGRKKSLSQFSKGIGKYGKRSACKQCLNFIAKRYRLQHRSECRKRSRDDYYKNKKRRLSQNKRWAKNNPDKVKVAHKLWLKNHPDGPSRYNRKYNYGLSFSEQRALLSRPCFICRNQSTVIDHDHKTKSVRGALCRKCNTGIGMLSDDPKLLRRGYIYLTRKRI